MAVLPELAALSKAFQRGIVNFGHIVPAINHTTDKLTKIAQEETPITHLQVDVQESGRLGTCNLQSNEYEVQVLHNLLRNYVPALKQNILYVSRILCQLFQHSTASIQLRFQSMGHRSLPATDAKKWPHWRSSTFQMKKSHDAKQMQNGRSWNMTFFFGKGKSLKNLKMSPQQSGV